MSGLCHTVTGFYVNDQYVSAPENRKLLPFLREELRLTGAKDGCSEGACGACMVIVEGRAMRACLLETARLAGKHIVTIEGLSPREKQVYSYAFAEAGAVQCGFCTPGMVISAKALLDETPDPSPQQVKAALRGNLCRCTGYKKIREAVLLAAKILRENLPVPPDQEKAAENSNGGEDFRITLAGAGVAGDPAGGPAGDLANSLPGSIVAGVAGDSAGGFSGGLTLDSRHMAGLGRDLHRVDAAAKTLGQAVYADDIRLPGMLYGGAVRSMLYPRARLVSLDVSRARALPGVIAVLTSADIPGAQKIGHLKQDWDVMIPLGSITHCLGDPVALIAAETKEILAKAKELVKAEYQELPCLRNPREALAEGAPVLHEEMGDSNILRREHLVRGDAQGKISGAKYVVTNHYSTPFTEHAFLEPETAVALPDPENPGGIRIYSGDQGIYQTRRECAAMLGLAEDKVRVTAAMVGGGFGGKEDMSVQHHAALLAWYVQKPVKVSLSRQESILIHPKRHAMEMDFTTACDEEGRLLAMKAVLIADTGAYASLGGPVLQRACTHAAGPYNYQDIDILGLAVYTNNPPAGAFRGFGVPQSCFAMECNLNQLAELVGISPWEIRRRNAVLPGQVLPNGQVADESTALVETLEAIKPYYDANPGAGIACAMKNSGLGVGVPDVGRARLLVKGGKVLLYSSAACIGQGMGTVQLQMVSQATGLGPAWLRYETPDTALAPNAGNTTASRQTVFTGEAVKRAAEKLRAALIRELGGGTAESRAAERGQAGQAEAEAISAAAASTAETEAEAISAADVEAALARLEGCEFSGEFSFDSDPLGCDKPNPVSHVTYGYATHLAELTPEGRVKRVVAAHDVGRVVNPKSLEGQIEGGVVMSLGYALTEDYPLENCRPNAKFGTLGLFRATDAPEVEAITLGKSREETAFGAKGVGEICSIPTAPAVQLAYYNRDGIFRNRLPLADTPYQKKGR